MAERGREHRGPRVSALDNLGYDAVEGIDTRVLEGKLAERAGLGVRVLGLDEIAQHKGHRDVVGVLSDIACGQGDRGLEQSYCCGLMKTDTLIRVIRLRRRCPTMTENRQTYTAEFKREAVRLVTEQRYGVAETARNLGINVHMLRRWKQAYTVSPPAAFPGNGRLTLEPNELRQRRDENKRLRMERDILKKAMRFFVNEPS